MVLFSHIFVCLPQCLQCKTTSKQLQSCFPPFYLLILKIFLKLAAMFRQTAGTALCHCPRLPVSPDDSPSHFRMWRAGQTCGGSRPAIWALLLTVATTFPPAMWILLLSSCLLFLLLFLSEQCARKKAGMPKMISRRLVEISGLMKTNLIRETDLEALCLVSGCRGEGVQCLALWYFSVYLS